jgi:hypothetical protein
VSVVAMGTASWGSNSAKATGQSQSVKARKLLTRC